MLSILFSAIFSLQAEAAPPVFVPAAQSPDHCEAALLAIAGTWSDCQVESLSSEATEMRPAVQQAELQAALGKPVVVALKALAPVKVGDKSFQQKFATLQLPLLAAGEALWFGKDNFAAPKGTKGFHVDYRIKDLACVAEGNAYRFQGFDKADGSRKTMAFFKGTRAGNPSPMLYIAGNAHNGMTQFAILCTKHSR